MAFLLRPPDLREQLTENLADLGRFRRRVAVATGLFRFVAVVVGCTAIACILDSLFHLPPLARAFALVGTLGLGGVLWIRGVSRSLALKTDSLSIALELEERHPKLNDALASAVEFIEAGEAEPRGLSNRLQEAAVKQARRLADRHNLDDLARVGACWRAGWVCGLVIALSVPLALVDTARATRSLTRLTDPFGHHAWPTRTRVELLLPEEIPARLPRGEPFDLRFVVRGEIPDRAVVVFRLADGDEFQEEYPLTAGNEPQYGSAAAVVAARIDPVRVLSSFHFRIVVNDYDSDWLAVEVVPPPRLIPYGNRPTPQFHIIPPAYTGLPAIDIDLPDSEQWLEAPLGSIVRMRAATDLPLAHAVMVFAGDRLAVSQWAPVAQLGSTNPFAAFGLPLLADGIGGDIAVSLDPTGRVLTAEFASAMTGIYHLRRTDTTGLTATRPVRIRIVPDPAPTVLLLRPAPGKDPAVLTPAAAIPVHVAADDVNYGLRRTFVEYRVGPSGAIRTIALEDVGAVASALPAAAGGTMVAAPPRPTTARPDPRLLPLAAITRDDGSPLQNGDRLFIRGAADDWDDVTACKEPGRSDEVEIVIAPPDTIEFWLQQNLAALRKDLTRLRELQHSARKMAGKVAIQPDGTLTPEDRDRLLASEQTQRQVRAKILDAQEGLRTRVELLRETVRVNDLPPSNTTHRVATAAEELGRLAVRDLPIIEPSLRQARELGLEPSRDRGLLAEQLGKAQRHQQAVEDGLADLIDLLAVWGAAGDIRADALALRDSVLRQAADVEGMGRDPAAAELDRAGTRASRAADQGRDLIGRAIQQAGEKGAVAARATGAADAAAREAAALRSKAAALPPGTPEKSALNAQAALLESARDDRLAEAKIAAAEADALRKGVELSTGEGIAEALRDAAAAIRQGQRFDTVESLRTAAARLDRLIDALAEEPRDEAPDLKKWKQSADDLDALAGAQDDLRRRAAEAARLADPNQRAAAFKKLADEQQRLIDRGKVVFQRLVRERADPAARDTRAALDHMEAARNQLESGDPGMRAQNDAVDRLDNARDRLDTATATAPQQLADEQRRKMADKVKALMERQKGRVAEADRLHSLVAAGKGWERDALVSYGDLADAEKAIAQEVRVLQKEFAQVPVLARLLGESAAAMESAAKRIATRIEDVDPALAFDAELETANDRRVKRPMDLAARRLQQLFDALQPGDPQSKKGTPKKAPTKTEAPPPTPQSGAQRDLIPPLAQLKVLRALQAELNERTAEFAKLHPDASKLTEEEREELQELELAQRDIAALFEEMARLFGPEEGPPEQPPPPREQPVKQQSKDPPMPEQP